MKFQVKQYSVLVLVILVILMVFMITLFVPVPGRPRLFDAFTLLIVAGCFFLLVKQRQQIHKVDWAVSLALGVIVAAGMLFSKYFSPYPFLGLIKSTPGQAVTRGMITTLSSLGGLVIMRQGGPVQFHIANTQVRKFVKGILIGLAVGIPLAILNVFALRFTQNQPITWQNLPAAMLDALQPAFVEEIVFRFALWGLLWLILKNTLPKQSAWISGVLSMLVHNFAHFDDLFLQSPLTALGMGLVMALFWGIPPLLLAKRRGLESAVAFHWIQDAARFLTGF